MVRQVNPRGGKKPLYAAITVTHPPVAVEWHPTKNYPVVAADVTQGVEEKYWWLGSTCGHAWPASPYNRTHGKNGGTGCAVCTGKLVVAGINDLLSQYPLIAAEWDYQANDGLRPEQVSCGSKKKVNWRCKKANHAYPATVLNRVLLNRGCPYCAGRYPVLGETDLPTMRPALMPEWDYESNTRAPETCMIGSDYKAGWKCLLAGHTWRTPVKVRALLGSGCPDCYKSTSAAEAELQAFLGKQLRQKIVTKNRKLLGDGKEVDILVPAAGLAVEYNGLYYHSVERGANKHETYHLDKYRNAAKAGVRLMHVWEDDWRANPRLIQVLLQMAVKKQLVQVDGRLSTRLLIEAEVTRFAESALFTLHTPTQHVAVMVDGVERAIFGFAEVQQGVTTLTNFWIDEAYDAASMRVMLNCATRLLKTAKLQLLFENGSPLMFAFDVEGFTGVDEMPPTLVPSARKRWLSSDCWAPLHIWDAGYSRYKP